MAHFTPAANMSRSVHVGKTISLRCEIKPFWHSEVAVFKVSSKEGRKEGRKGRIKGTLRSPSILGKALTGLFCSKTRFVLTDGITF